MPGKGEQEENRARFKEHRLMFPAVRQQQWKISRRYTMLVTPVTYLINEADVVVSDVAVGDAIVELLSEAGIPTAVTACPATRD